MLLSQGSSQKRGNTPVHFRVFPLIFMAGRVDTIRKFHSFPFGPIFRPPDKCPEVCFCALPKVTMAHGVRHQAITIDRQIPFAQLSAAHMGKKRT
jgi:hypothetical protein